MSAEPELPLRPTFDEVMEAFLTFAHMVQEAGGCLIARFEVGAAANNSMAGNPSTIIGMARILTLAVERETVSRSFPPATIPNEGPP